MSAVMKKKQSWVKPPSKTEMLIIRVEPTLRDALRAAADGLEDTMGVPVSVSGLVTSILRKHLKIAPPKSTIQK